MKRSISYYLCFILFFAVKGFGATEQNFDRLKSFHASSFIFTPYSHYIKEQTIVSESNGKRTSARIFKYNEKGDAVFHKTELVGKPLFDSIGQFDYVNDSFVLRSNFHEVNIKKGWIIKNDHDQITALVGKNDGKIFDNDYQFTYFYKYENDKVVESINKAGPLQIESKITWQNDLPIRSESSLVRYGTVNALPTSDYSYDEQGRLKAHRLKITIPHDESFNSESETLFSDYNEYGDWTKATTIGTQKEGTNVEITIRKIEYW
ncbi:hypothetical protein RCS94_08385 [Orbaceae bacterium ac157xtp]